MVGRSMYMGGESYPDLSFGVLESIFCATVVSRPAVNGSFSKGEVSPHHLQPTEIPALSDGGRRGPTHVCMP